MQQWIIQISAGVGPIEVRHFVAKLATVLVRDLQRCGMVVHAQLTYGPESEPTAIQFHVEGLPETADELLGTYELIARNPERGKKSRKRWFVGVELFNYSDLKSGFSIDENDLRITTSCAGGPGGQHVNRTESAVRVVHIPSGVTVRVTSERSQHANRKQAISLIHQALHEQAALNSRNAAREQRHHHHRVIRGNAIRSFRLDRRGRLVEERRRGHPIERRIES